MAADPPGAMGTTGADGPPPPLCVQRRFADRRGSDADPEELLPMIPMRQRREGDPSLDPLATGICYALGIVGDQRAVPVLTRAAATRELRNVALLSLGLLARAEDVPVDVVASSAPRGIPRSVPHEDLATRMIRTRDPEGSPGSASCSPGAIRTPVRGRAARPGTNHGAHVRTTRLVHTHPSRSRQALAALARAERYCELGDAVNADPPRCRT